MWGQAEGGPRGVLAQSCWRISTAISLDPAKIVVADGSGEELTAHSPETGGRLSGGRIAAGNSSLSPAAATAKARKAPAGSLARRPTRPRPGNLRLEPVSYAPLVEARRANGHRS